MQRASLDPASPQGGTHDPGVLSRPVDRGGYIVFIADAAHGALLGAHLVGAEVSELLPSSLLPNPGT